MSRKMLRGTPARLLDAGVPRITNVETLHPETMMRYATPINLSKLSVRLKELATMNLSSLPLTILTVVGYTGKPRVWSHRGHEYVLCSTDALTQLQKAILLKHVATTGRASTYALDFTNHPEPAKLDPL